MGGNSPLKRCLNELNLNGVNELRLFFCQPAILVFVVKRRFTGNGYSETCHIRLAQTQIHPKIEIDSSNCSSLFIFYVQIKAIKVQHLRTLKMVFHSCVVWLCHPRMLSTNNSSTKRNVYTNEKLRLAENSYTNGLVENVEWCVLSWYWKCWQWQCGLASVFLCFRRIQSHAMTYILRCCLLNCESVCMKS